VTTQFDVFPNPVTAARRAYPFVICMQSALLADGSDQVVAPLAPRRHLPDTKSPLFPAVRIDEDEFVVMVTRLFTLPARDLSRRAANLARSREALLGAVDLLFYGV
jgi:toxin CcdB